MNISFLDPLGRAWTRMKLILFSPFDATKWIVLGFTAWLAELTDSLTEGGGGGKQMRGKCDFSDGWDGCMDWAYGTADSVREFFVRSLEVSIISFIVLAAFALWILLLWLSSRGAFMFLDNVVHNRAEVKQPWRQFKYLGNSLFIWRLLFNLVCLLAFGPLVALAVVVCMPMIVNESAALISIPALIGIGSLFFVFLIAAIFVDFFLLHLVVPTMYRNNLRATDAWRKFLPVLRQHIGSFFLYALFILVLNLCVGVVAVMFGLMTCCMGLLLLAIPVIGTTLLLPIHVTFRVFDLEFLAQFGDEFNLVQPTAAD